MTGQGEQRRKRWWVFPAVIGLISGVGTLAAVFAGRLDSPLKVALMATAATALTAFSTIYTVDQSRTSTAAGAVPDSLNPVPAPAPAPALIVAPPPHPPPKPAAVLVSHEPADHAWAGWIAKQLEACGYRATTAPWPAGPPTRLEADAPSDTAHVWLAQQAVGRLAEADRVLILVSRAYARARRDGHRWPALLLNPAPGPDGTRPPAALPVLVEACDVEPGSVDGDMLNLIGLEAEVCKQELLAGLRRRGLPAPNPTGPTISTTLPGRGPAISNMRAANASFVGRREQLDELYRALHPVGGQSGQGGQGRPQTTAGLHAVVVHGQGGVGKTDLAYQYAWDNADEYDIVWWVQAGTPVGTVNSLIDLAKALEQPEKANHDEVVINLWAALRKRDHWLLIFDDMIEPGAVNPTHWPNTKCGHVLVTTRVATGWDRLAADSMRLGQMSAQEAANFLVERIPEAAELPEVTAEVAALLGHLPLALAQAAAYVRETGTGLAAYHVLLRDQFDDVLTAQRVTNEAAGGYSLIPLLAVEERAPAARDLLALLSMFGPASIPRRMIAHHADVLPERLRAAMSDELKNLTAVGELTRFSLIEAFADRFNVHPVDQSTMRSTLTSEELRLWSRVAIRLLRRAFPRYPDEPGSWSESAFLTAHVEAATGVARRLGELDERAAHLLLLAAIYLHSRCDWSQAQTFLRLALEIRTIRSGSEDLGVAECLFHLGRSQFPLAQLEEARESVARALEIREARLEPDHPQIAGALTHLAEIMREFGTRNDAALEYCERAEQILRRLRGNESAIADTLLIRGTILCNAGRLGDALRAQRESLALNERKRANGPISVEAGVNHGEIGRVHRQLGQWEAAREEFEACLAIMEPVLGSDHLDVAKAKKYLADIHRRTGDLASAHALISEVTEIHRRRPGEEHRLAPCLAKLGSIELEQKRPDEAREHLEAALKIYEEAYARAYGPRHPYTAKVLSRLGPVYLAQNQPDRAEEALLRAQGIFEGSYGPDHPALVWVLQSLAEIHDGRPAGEAVAGQLRARAAGILRRAAD